jgi:hypothetical protein
MAELKDFNLVNTPKDVTQRLLEKHERLKAAGLIKPNKRGRVTIGGDALRYILDRDDVAEAMGITPEQLQPQAQA